MFALKNKIGSGTIAFVKNVGQLFGATTIGQGISLILAPIVARIFGPEAYGTASILLAIVGIAAISATLRYEQAIVIAKDSIQAQSLVRLCFTLAVGFSLVCCLVIGATWFVVDEQIESWLGNDRRLLFLLPVLVLLLSTTRILNALQTRLEGFRYLAREIVATSIVVPSSRIAIASVTTPSATGLIAGNMIGLVVSVAVLRSGITDYWRGLFRREKNQGCWATARIFSDFPRYSATTELLNTVSSQLPIYVLAFMYSPTIVGLYALAKRLVKMPVQALGKSVRQAYYKNCAEKQANGENLVVPLVKTTVILIAIGSIPFGILILFGEEIFTFILGDSWSVSGRYASFLAPWLFTALLIVPYQVTLTVIRRQEFWFRCQIIVMLLRAGAFVAAYEFELGAEQAIRLFATTSFVANVIIIAIAFRIIARVNRT